MTLHVERDRVDTIIAEHLECARKLRNVLRVAAAAFALAVLALWLVLG